MIPRLIQLHWFYDVRPIYFDRVVEEYRSKYPTWDVRVVTEIPAMTQELGAVLEQVPDGRLKADLIRYWLMKRDGGFYVDFDSRPIGSLESLVGKTLVMPLCALGGAPFIDICLIGSGPGHPFWDVVLEKALRWKEGRKPKTVFWTGSLIGSADEHEALGVEVLPVGGVQEASPEETIGFHKGEMPVLTGEGYIKHYRSVSKTQRGEVPWVPEWGIG